MGNFYTNVVVRGPPIADVVDLLRSLRRDAYVGSIGDRFSIVCDREADTQKDGVIDSLALTMAVRLKCPSLASLNHDDDLVILWLFDQGGTLEQYGWKAMLSSWDVPGGSRRNFVRRVRELFGTQARAGAPAPWKLLPLMLFARHIFAVEVHRSILDETGLPEVVCQMGFRYVARGELANVPGLQITHV